MNLSIILSFNVVFSDSYSVLSAFFIQHASDPVTILLFVSALIPFFIILLVLISISAKKYYHYFKVYERLVQPLIELKANTLEHGFLPALGYFVYNMVIGKPFYPCESTYNRPGVWLGSFHVPIGHPCVRIWREQIFGNAHYQFGMRSLLGQMMLVPITLILFGITVYLSIYVFPIFDFDWASIFSFGGFSSSCDSSSASSIAFIASIAASVGKVKVTPNQLNEAALKILKSKQGPSLKAINDIALVPNGFSPLTQKEYKALMAVLPSEKIMWPPEQDRRKDSVILLLNSILGTKKDNILFGVYVFTNTITQEVYVGSAINLRRRIANYVSDVKDETARRKIIVSMKEYGMHNFSLEVYVLNSLVKDPSDVKRLIIALEQHMIFLLAPKLNVIIAAHSVVATNHSEMAIEDFNKMINAASLAIYVYVNNILVYQDISVPALSKVIGLSVNRLFVNMRQGTLVFGKFLISRQGPDSNTVVNLISKSELIADAEAAKSKILAKSGASVILTHIDTNETFNFISVRAAERFVNENYPSQTISMKTLRKQVKQANYNAVNHKGWIIHVTEKKLVRSTIFI